MEPRRHRRRPASVPRTLVWLGGVLMLLAVADFVRCLPALFEARQTVAALDRDLASLSLSHEALRQRVRRLRDDPRAVEEVARRDLGMIRPGEVVFIIVDAPRSVATPAH